ncbi:MAG: 50S ribosomal protein L1 [Chlamydiae bacterium GWA2_50_15]|nr:MAG: 50S ribosomal protein L1 [Chlamydiae bacterium GWA2_50_15]OGN64143.1 MAG: 50S ribosomal protein L1 [Chlamydiae bacterium RIFCSPHIGHO2_12_FULL_49_32]OGN68217.1 MAG: 50S ribosomal protein L1 [Chlamydiae bacterium RIFCSPLOWO2_02_FULL_49_12]
MKLSKRMKAIDQKVRRGEVYSAEEAVDLLKECPPVKFDQTVEMAIQTGVDLRKPDQGVRGTVALPHGTGKSLIILVFARGEKIQQALDAGADFAGAEDLLEKVKEGWTQFDAVVSTPDMMREVGKLGKILGPRGLMPTPKAGTVTAEVAKAVKDLKGGKIEFKTDKHGVIHAIVGKLSFNKEKLVENLRFLVTAIARARPAAAKGQFLQSAALSTTMGPGLKIDLSTLIEAK